MINILKHDEKFCWEYPVTGTSGSILAKQWFESEELARTDFANLSEGDFAESLQALQFMIDEQETNEGIYND